ncbi:hypothetical protein [Abditibacterium utsteinense]|uniref:hypothetical protein n=1 Tax=Abditibacterium utsteinense TaxID=1960156 RepID=UPI001EE77109|nr:hypothetical protein [Abditibacterium utsteinense]
MPAWGARAGAARALRFIDSEGRPLQGSFSDPAWETRGVGLFFTRNFGGTRNIWRAFPDPRDRSRYPSWRALPVTQFEAPLFASHPVPLAGDRALLLVSNAVRPRGAAQITLFDLKNPALRALTDEPNGAFDPAPAPDGSAFAYTASRGQITSVWVQNLAGQAGSRSGQNAEAAAKNARRPAWQNAATLLVESVDDGSIYRLSRPWRANLRPVRLAVGFQVSASRDGSTLVLGGKVDGEPRLYLLAGDGSGLRVLSSTQNADAPALSGNGRLLAFAAPLPGQETRALWFLPLELETAVANAELPPATSVLGVPLIPARDAAPESTKNEVTTRLDAPLAQIRGIQSAARGALAIIGSATGQNASATLEIGQGAVPKRWEARPVALPVPPGAPLLVWNPPPAARGIWSFRLLVSNSSGAAQSVFSVQLPLSPGISAPSNNFLNSMPAGGPLPRAPLPDLPAPPSLPRPAPLPPLLPAPPQIHSRPNSPRNSLPRPRPTLPGINSPGTKFPGANAPSIFSPQVVPAGRDAATFNVSNTLAQIKAGQTVSVTFWALNRGTRAWDAGSAGRSAGAVRLVTRWIRLDNGNRRKWTLQWMKTSVAPRARTRWSFDVTAPPQPGRYKLIYGLVRVPSDNWTPPAFDAPQDNWPDEFAAIAFAVTVKP